VFQFQTNISGPLLLVKSLKQWEKHKKDRIQRHLKSYCIGCFLVDHAYTIHYEHIRDHPGSFNLTWRPEADISIGYAYGNVENHNPKKAVLIMSSILSNMTRLVS
jgi:hypothetical protein